MSAGIGRTVRPGEEMAAEPEELGGVAARTSFVTARTELGVQKGGIRWGKLCDVWGQELSHWLGWWSQSISLRRNVLGLAVVGSIFFFFSLPSPGE